MSNLKLNEIKGLTILFDKCLLRGIREISPKYADIKQRNDQALKESLKDLLLINKFLCELEISSERRVISCIKLLSKLLTNNNINSLPLMNNHGKIFDEWFYENKLKHKMLYDHHFNNLYI